MTHLVKYTKADGQLGDHEVEELHEAIAHVERLRNEEGVEDAKIFRIEAVAFEFKPYYRVELGGTTEAPPAASAPAAPEVASAATSWTPPADAAPVAEPAEVSEAAEASGAPEREPAHAAAPMAEGDTAPMVDPWADAPPPPAPVGAEPEAAANGRRGLFGR